MQENPFVLWRNTVETDTASLSGGMSVCPQDFRLPYPVYLYS